jgi:hypothetical protein
VLLEILPPALHKSCAVNHLQNRFVRDSSSVLAATDPPLTTRQTQRRGGTGGDKLRPYREKAELARLGGRALQVDARARFNNNGCPMSGKSNDNRVPEEPRAVESARDSTKIASRRRLRRILLSAPVLLLMFLGALVIFFLLAALIFKLYFGNGFAPGTS